MKADTRRRLEALEAANPPEGQGPSVIFLVGCKRQPDGSIGGEASAALFTAGGSVSRNEGETEADFTARVEAMAEGKTAGVQMTGDVPLTDAGRLDPTGLSDESLKRLLKLRRGAFRETEGRWCNG